MRNFFLFSRDGWEIEGVDSGSETDFLSMY
jgi:hypothetical protein